MPAKKPKSKPRPRSKVTIEIDTRLKRRLMAYAGARGEKPKQVLARALVREMAKFKFEGADSQSPAELADQGDDAPRLKAV